MKTKEFEAKTQKGITLTIKAENTPDGLKSNYPVQLRPTKDGNKYCAVLNAAQAKEILNIELPAKYKECGVCLVQQDEWREFEQECSRERYEIEQDRLEDLFPGLQALKDARSAEANYHESFERAMENENTVVYPTPPKVNAKDLAEHYPVAAAYLKAKGFAQSDNVGKYSAGAKAVTRLECGEDYTQVIIEMEAEWSKYCDEHIWD
jgi:hypothetical protein